MPEETRKDARAKIVSLNVRYKSATVDEFIENHSYDVSKGGVFIKTATPFAPGTLLKFEIRIAGDVAVIGGVGRVVWKREGASATPEAPAGMGVKFIKLDDASRATINRLVETKGDAKSAFDAGAGDVDTAAPAVAETVSTKPTTAPPAPTAAAPQATPALAARKPPTPAPAAPAAARAPAASAAAEAAASPIAAFFPSTNSAGDMPPVQERTVMKQAAELLEEALKGAGGSMDEVGQNPLFDEPKRIVPSTSLEDSAAAPTPETAPEPEKAKAPESHPPPKSAPAAVATPAAAIEKPKPIAVTTVSSSPSAASGKKSNWVVPAAVVVGLVVAGFAGFSMLGGGSEDTKTVPSATAAPPIPSAPPVVSAAPPASAAPSAAPSAEPSASAAASAAPSSAPSSAASAAPTTPVPAPPVRRRAPRPAPTPEPPSDEAPTPPSTPTPSPAAPPTPAPTPTPTAAPTPTPTPTPPTTPATPTPATPPTPPPTPTSVPLGF